MDQFNIVFREFEQGGRGIFIEDERNHIFEGVIMDQDQFDEVIEILEGSRGNIGQCVILQLGDLTGSKLVLSAFCFESDNLVFTLQYKGKRKQKEQIISTYYEGKTTLFYRSTPAGSGQRQVF